MQGRFLDMSQLTPHPCRDASVGVIRSGGFRAASFFATTPVAPEALDHRLSSRTAFGVPKAQPIALATVDSEVAAMAWFCRYAGGGVGHD